MPTYMYILIKDVFAAWTAMSSSFTVVAAIWWENRVRGSYYSLFCHFSSKNDEFFFFSWHKIEVTNPYIEKILKVNNVSRESFQAKTKGHSFCKQCTRSSVYENKVLLTKPFQASQSWHQPSGYGNKVLVHTAYTVYKTNGLYEMMFLWPEPFTCI